MLQTFNNTRRTALCTPFAPGWAWRLHHRKQTSGNPYPKLAEGAIIAHMGSTVVVSRRYLVVLDVVLVQVRLLLRPPQFPGPAIEHHCPQLRLQLLRGAETETSQLELKEAAFVASLAAGHL